MTYEQLDFTTYCVGLLACRLGMNQRDVYDKLKESDILDDYIVKAYDVLHTFSSDYIADDLLGYMKEKGVME